MIDYIEYLVSLGISIEQAKLIVENIAQYAYESGYNEGTYNEPAIIGETLGQNGMDFFEWWEKQIN